MHRRVGAAVVVLFLLLGPARSTTVERLPLEALVERSETVAHGDCVAVRTEWDAGRTRIYTRVSIAPREVLKGGAGADRALLELVLPGGELDGMAYVVHGMPRARVGEELVVFATAAHPRSGVRLPCGLGQGLWTVERAGRAAPAAVRDTRELRLVERGVAGGEAGGVERAPLDDLLARVRAEAARQRGPR